MMNGERKLRALRTFPLLYLLGLILVGGVYADLPAAPDYPISSGIFGNGGSQIEKVYSTRISAPDVPWIRLHFGSHNLGRASYIVITSMFDGGVQRHDGRSLADYRQYSAFFNGDAVTVDLYVAPGDSGVFIQINEPILGTWASTRDRQYMKSGKSLCGGDDRLPSYHDAVGRITSPNNPMTPNEGAGTAFIVSNGALATAGHMVGPSPYYFADGTIQFNVPASLPDGTLQHSHPDDQYSTDPNYVKAETGFVACLQISDEFIGNDWAVFECLPNSNTGLLPVHAQASFFRLTNEVPAANDWIRVTGYGDDTDPPGTGGSYNQFNNTLQTDIGPFVAEGTSGANVWHQYQVDTRGGNSGSPVIRAADGLAIGIHTTQGCAEGCGGNYGTSFNNLNLANALQTFLGANCTYVDWATSAPNENGTVFEPYNTILEGVNTVVSGGKLIIVKGTYNEVVTINKAITLEAPVGNVIISQ